MLLSKLKRLSKDSFVYGFGSVVEFISAFFLLPVFTRIFTPSDYGILDSLSTLSSITLLVFLFGLNSALQRYYFDTNDTTERKILFSTTSYFLLLVGALVCAIGILVSPLLSQILFRTDTNTASIQLMFGALPLYLIITHIKDFLRLQFSPWRYNFMSLLDFILRIVLILLFVVVFHMGIVGNFLGLLLASFATVLLGIWYTRQWYVKQFASPIIGKLLRYGMPLVFAGLAYWIISLSDRFFIMKLATLEQLGLYSIANKISSVLTLPITAFGLAWAPLVFAHHQHDRDGRMMIKTLTYTLVVLMLCGITISGLSYEILLLLAPHSYLDAMRVVPPLVLGLVFLGISAIVSTGLTLVKKTKFLTLASLWAAGTNILLNVALIPSFGYVGAAYATLISYFVLVVVSYLYSQRHYPIKYETKKITKIILIGVPYFAFLSPPILGSIVWDVPLKILLLFLYPLLLTIFGVFDKEEIFIAKIFIRTLLQKRFSTSDNTSA